MKNAILVILVVVVLGAAAFFYSQSKTNQNNGQMQATVTESPTNEEPTAAMQKGEVKEISMEAKQWEFIPASVTVKEGDTVRLKIKSTDVDHGIAIPEFNVNSTLEPGKETTVEFVASKKGEFTFFCSVLCGKGHKTMTGKLIVE